MVRFELRNNPKGQEVEYVLIDSGGGNVAHRQATDADKKAFPEEYASFLDGDEPEAAPRAESTAVAFSLVTPPGKDEPAEYIRIVTGSDVVHRKATDDDRRAYADAYESFQGAE